MDSGCSYATVQAFYIVLFYIFFSVMILKEIFISSHHFAFFLIMGTKLG